METIGCYGCRCLAQQLADAQATVEALQAKVSELQGIADEKCRCFLERAEQSEKQLTQRTAELEAAKAIIKQMGEQAAVLAKDGMAAKAQVEALQRERDEAKQVTENVYKMAREDAKEYEQLRTLIAALPKVEGEIEVSSGVYNFILLKHDSGTRFLCGQIETEQTAKAYAALLQHRQGMEG